MSCLFFHDLASWRGLVEGLAPVVGCCFCLVSSSFNLDRKYQFNYMCVSKKKS